MGEQKKGDWDVGLAVDAIKLAPKLDTVIIASGDGDFCPLVEYLQTNEGCQVEVISFGKSSSQKLKEVADDFIDMCDSPSKYVMMQNSQQNTGERGNRQERPNKEIQTRPKNNPAPKKQSKNSNENKPITTNTRKDFDFFDPEERPDSKFDI